MTRFEKVVRDTLISNRLEGRKPDSIRGLARAMAGGDAARAETFKRSLFKWMAKGEANPSRESRALVALALGIDASELEEEDDADADTLSLIDALLQRRIEAAVQRALAAAANT